MNPYDTRDPSLHGIEKQYHQVTLRERLLLLFTGLRAPRDSREYKMARIEAQRLAAPAIAILTPLILVAAIAIFAVAPRQPRVERWSHPINPNPDDAIRDDLIPTPEPTKNEPDAQPDPFKIWRDGNIDNVIIDPEIKFPGGEIVEPVPGLVPTLTGINTKPVIGEPKRPWKQGDPPYHGDPPPNGPTGGSELAVMRGLRWLKLNQNPDGSWNANKPAMTGLALLAFLAHDELPGTSPEFGDTVKRGIEYLLATYNTANNRFAGADGHEYAHLIATYALCEAYGMTKNPNIRAVIEPAVKRIIEGQHPTGGWDYKLAQTDRADTSYMGWAAQALKIARVADLFANNPEWRAKLETACKRSNNGFLRNAAPGGGFGYTGPAKGGLTAVGVLSMQLHGSDKPHRQVTDSLKLMEAWQPGWFATADEVSKLGLGGALQYYYYYATQAKFLAGGKQWNAWNAAMITTYKDAQKVREKAIADPAGVLQDIGWWENADNHSDRPVMDTCLAVLQLEVYYRHDWITRLGAQHEYTAIDLVDANDLIIETHL